MKKVKRSVVVICEGMTERHYIESLRVHKRYRFALKPVWRSILMCTLFKRWWKML